LSALAQASSSLRRSSYRIKRINLKSKALNLELADKEAKGVELTPPGLPVLAGESVEFMSNDCVTVGEVDKG